MNGSNKYYTKALNYYEKGYIDKAMECSERSISLDINNKAAIDLKGILYYLKGDLKNAKALWKLNSQMNKDGAAKKYLHNITYDEERLELFLQAVKLIKEVKIKEAVELLNKCKESDFNSINVNNYLCICYMKQCKFQEAEEKLNKVLKLDRKNQLALDNRKQLMDYDIVTRKINFKPVILTITAILLVTGISYLTINLIRHYSKTKASASTNTSISSKTNNSTKTTSAVKKASQQTAVAEEKFPTAAFESALDNKDFQALYNYVETWNNKALDINDKKALSQGEALLSNEGTSYFYKNGTAFYNKNDFVNAVTEFTKAYTNGSSSYLYPHITYFLASSYYNSKDYENAIKYYTIYDTNYSKGDYEETVLYNLAITYKDIDGAKAKQYADKLINSFPDSIYNNSNMKNIIKN